MERSAVVAAVTHVPTGSERCDTRDFIGMCSDELYEGILIMSSGLVVVDLEGKSHVFRLALNHTVEAILEKLGLSHLSEMSVYP
jgi:hypothetical protein